MNIRWNHRLKFATICQIEGDGGAGGGGEGGAGGAGGGAGDNADGGGAGGGAGGAGGAGGGGGDGADQPFYEAFTKEALKTSPTIQKFKNAEDLAEGYVGLEKRLGVDPNRQLILPADPKDEAAMKAVWTKLGLPEAADKYGIELDGTPSDNDKAFLGRFLEEAHKANMPADFAKASVGFWIKEMTAAREAAETAQAAARAEALASLKKEWGEAFESRSKEVGALLNKYGGAELAKLLDGDAIGNHPHMAIALGKIIEAMAEPAGGGVVPGEVKIGGVLTPSQAKAAISQLETNPALRDAHHPQHKAVVEQRIALLAQANPAA